MRFNSSLTRPLTRLVVIPSKIVRPVAIIVNPSMIAVLVGGGGIIPDPHDAPQLVPQLPPHVSAIYGPHVGLEPLPFTVTLLTFLIFTSTIPAVAGVEYDVPRR